MYSDNFWLCQGRCFVVSDDFKWILVKFLHETAHGTDRLIVIFSQCSWRNFRKTAEVIFMACVTWQQCNCKGDKHMASDQRFKVPLYTFQGIFIQVLFSMGKCV